MRTCRTHLGTSLRAPTALMLTQRPASDTSLFSPGLSRPRALSLQCPGKVVLQEGDPGRGRWAQTQEAVREPERHTDPWGRLIH